MMNLQIKKAVPVSKNFNKGPRNLPLFQNSIYWLRIQPVRGTFVIAVVSSAEDKTGPRQKSRPIEIFRLRHSQLPFLNIP